MEDILPDAVELLCIERNKSASESLAKPTLDSKDGFVSSVRV